MKMGNRGKFSYIAGFTIFIFSFIVFLIVPQEQKIDAILLGLSGLTLLWVMGVQDDLYREKK